MPKLADNGQAIARAEFWEVLTSPAPSIRSRLRRQTRFKASANGFIEHKPNKDRAIVFIGNLGPEYQYSGPRFFAETRTQAEFDIRAYICEQKKLWLEQQEQRDQVVRYEADQMCP